MFRRKKRSSQAQDPAVEESPTDVGGDEPATTGQAATGRPSGGPYDVSEVAAPEEGRVDLGALWVPTLEGMQLRVDVDQRTSRIAAVTVILAESALQVQAYAAPRHEGIWDEVRTEIANGARAGGGSAEEAEGPFGTELRAKVPVRRPDGQVGAQLVRFVGVDGPRWLLRGAFTGRAYDDPEAAAALEGLFRGVVVVRGSEPMPPREMIPLRLPAQLQQQLAPGAAPGGGPGAEPGTGPRPEPGTPGMAPPERGPEITEIR